MRTKCLWMAVLLVLFSSSVALTASDPKFLAIGTAGSGGAYYPIGIAMADIITNKLGVQTTAQITGGAIENNILINNKTNDLAITIGFMAYFARNGMPPYKTKLDNVMGLFSGLSKGMFQVAVDKNSPIQSIKDLKGKKVSLGPAGGGAITLFMQVIQFYGFNEKEFKPVYTSYEQSADALVDGNLDAILVHAAAPTPALMQLTAAKKPIRYLSIDDQTMQQLVKKYPYMIPVTLGKEMYKTDEPLKIFYTTNVVVVNKELDTDLVYRIDKAFFDNIDKIRASHPSCKGLDLASAVQGLPIPYHPGAVKFFTEKGLTIK
jgi:TRAP transporter TAXI family solute receptor